MAAKRIKVVLPQLMDALHLIKVLERHHPGSLVHGVTTAYWSQRIANQMDIESESNILLAGLLHDIGKLFVPSNLLDMQGPILMRKEQEKIEAHTYLGEDLLLTYSSFERAAGGPLFHHERWDGSGYPHKMQGKRIPIHARVIAVADIFAAMTEDRSYRKAMPVEDVIRHLSEEAGKLFDPEVVEALIAVVEAEEG